MVDLEQGLDAVALLGALVRVIQREAGVVGLACAYLLQAQHLPYLPLLSEAFGPAHRAATGTITGSPQGRMRARRAEGPALNTRVVAGPGADRACGTWPRPCGDRGTTAPSPYTATVT